MNVPRRYQIIPDTAVCLHYHCVWPGASGSTAQSLAEQHYTDTGHETQVTTAATVTFGTRQQDTPDQQAARRAELARVR